MRILFDTNVFRDIQRGNIDIGLLVEALAKDGHHAVVSPLTLVELGSHIREEEKADFIKYRDAFRAINQVCRADVPDPEEFTRTTVFRAPPSDEGMKNGETLELCRLISSATTYDEFVDGREFRTLGAQTRIAFNAGILHRFRTGYENQYVADMYTHVLSPLIPDYANRRGAGKPIRLDGPDDMAAFSSFLANEFWPFFLQGLAARAHVHLIGEAGEWEASIKKQLAAFFEGYCSILKMDAQSGYNFDRRRNDFNDLHFLIYLADPGLALVTGDKGLIDKVPNWCEQKERLLITDVFLASLAGRRED